MRNLKTSYLWLWLVEARVLILLGALTAAAFVGLILLLSGRSGGDRRSGDLYWHPAAADTDTICNTYGEATVCFPATEGVKKYRREQEARREAERER